MALIYVQRIYDTTLGQYVRYETQAPTSSPNPASTTPVSTGSYDTAKHQILQVYDDPAVSGGGGSSSVLVYDSLAVPSGNVYATWSALYAAIGTAAGPVEVSLKTGLTIPSGAWTVERATFTSYYPGRPVVTLADGCVVTAGSWTFKSVDIQWVGTTVAPIALSSASGSPRFILYAEECTISATGTPTYALISYATGTAGIYLYDVCEVDTTGGAKLANVSGTGVWATLVAGANAVVGNEPYSGNGTIVINQSSASGSHGTTATFTGTIFRVNKAVATEVEYTDTVLPVLGSTNVQGAIDAIKPYLGVSSSNILFQWNQTDISQFDLSSAVSSPSGNLQNSNYFLVDIYNYGRNYLRIRGGSLLAQYSYLALPILTSAFASALPNRYEIEIELEGNQTAIAAVYCGPLLSWLSPTGTGCGIGATQSATAPARRVFESGASVLSSDSDGNHSLTPFAPQSSNYRGGNYRFRVEHYLNAGQPTAIVAQAETHSWWQWSVTDRYPYRSLVTPELFRTTAAWNDYVPNTVGLYFVHATALGGNTDILIRDIIVRKHPKDM